MISASAAGGATPVIAWNVRGRFTRGAGGFHHAPEENEILYWLGGANPFTHAVEWIRFSLYTEWNTMSVPMTLGTTLVLTLLAVMGFRPERMSKVWSGLCIRVL